MPKARFSIAHNDDEMLTLVEDTDQKTLAVWAIDCAERVLPFFEQQFPDDQRPRHAIEARSWDSGALRRSLALATSCGG